MSNENSILTNLDEFKNICMSGAANGADAHWGKNAKKAGHYVLHWSFDSHKAYAPENEIVRLSNDLLIQADPYLKRANKTLKRSFPSSNPSTNNLLRRNWYQVKDTNTLYAVTELKLEAGKLMPQGGTAWAIQMYIDRFLIDNEPIKNANLWVFEKKLKKWFKWNEGVWAIQISKPPCPSGLWTGIGSRELDIWDKIEIEKILGTYQPDLDTLAKELHPIIENPNINDIIYVPDQQIPNNGKLNRVGGWATVRRVLKGDKTYIYTQELYHEDEICWEDIKFMQQELRQRFNISRAFAKPDYSTG
jgi:hypothetical protein